MLFSGMYLLHLSDYFIIYRKMKGISDLVRSLVCWITNSSTGKYLCGSRPCQVSPLRGILEHRCRRASAFEQANCHVAARAKGNGLGQPPGAEDLRLMVARNWILPTTNEVRRPWALDEVWASFDTNSLVGFCSEQPMNLDLSSWPMEMLK